jgi:hypothetical protein
MKTRKSNKQIFELPATNGTAYVVGIQLGQHFIYHGEINCDRDALDWSAPMRSLSHRETRHNICRQLLTPPMAKALVVALEQLSVDWSESNAGDLARAALAAMAPLTVKEWIKNALTRPALTRAQRILASPQWCGATATHEVHVKWGHCIHLVLGRAEAWMPLK